MAQQTTRLTAEVTWDQEVLEFLTFSQPRALWVAEHGDVVLPRESLEAPRVLLANVADGAWTWPDGAPIHPGQARTWRFGAFVVRLRCDHHERATLPRAWPQELGTLSLAMALALAVVFVPLWLGRGIERKRWQAATEEDVAAITVVVPIVGNQETPEDVAMGEAAPEPQEPRIPETPHPLPPLAVDRADPLAHSPPPTPAPQPPAPARGPAPERQPSPRRGPTRTALPDGQVPVDLHSLDNLGTPSPGKPLDWGDDSPGALAKRNGTDLTRERDLAGRPKRPMLGMAEPEAPRAGKERTDLEPDLGPDAQRVVVVKQAAPAVEGSGLSGDAVHEVIQRMHGQLRHCLELGMLGSVQLSGRVRVSFVIGADGQVDQARVVDSALGNAQAESCMVERIRGWQFPAAASGLSTRVRHGFVFKVR